MILRAPFDRPEVLSRLRPAYREQRSLILPNACDPALQTQADLAPFFLAHRGRYAIAELPEPLELRMVAEAVTGLTILRHAWTRLYRFRRGGYSLSYDDDCTRIERGVEVLCDLSEGTGGPPCHYGSLLVPQVAGLVAVVERSAQIFRSDRYLPTGSARILRLRAAFAI